MITRINESKSVRKHMPCKCKCKFEGKNVIEISNGIAVNVDMSVKSTIFVKNIIFGILLYVVAETKKKLANIIDNSVIISDEIKDPEAETKLCG